MIFLVLLTKLSPYGDKIPTDFFFQVRKSETTKIFFLTEKVIVRGASITMPSFCLKITHMSLSHSKGEDYIRM